uniref:Uncharacterized protein n=1 Tax=Vitrella brassicaformis TaxID=1169539 RepID=A0A7S1JT56_9ALVE|mmetsp:Transcript_22573/g.55681  ORF Transcript_22573/g.55681 Transcript_22573/m.55681 type:complete len:120 (+) Transcript_22573:270-629(+)
MDGCAHTCLPAYPVFGCPFGCLSVCLLGFMELVRPSFHFSGRSCALTDTFCSVCGVSSHGMCGGMCAYRSDDIHPSSNTYTHTHTHTCTATKIGTESHNWDERQQQPSEWVWRATQRWP